MQSHRLWVGLTSAAWTRKESCEAELDSERAGGGRMTPPATPAGPCPASGPLNRAPASRLRRIVTDTESGRPLGEGAPDVYRFQVLSWRCRTT